MGRFDSISPLDFRYASPDTSLGREIAEYFSENARIRYQALVEAALVKALAKLGVCSKDVAEEVEKACLEVKAEDVYAEEAVTKHDVRALVNCIRGKVGDKAKPFVHFSTTSCDIIDTSVAVRFKEATEKLVLPKLLELEKTLVEIAEREKSTLQIGRTHGRHSEPVTFGFFMAEFVNRLGDRILAIKNAKDSLRGKFSGAVGAYNASSLLVKDPLELEKIVMDELGLKPFLHSTQIMEPEPISDLSHAVVSAFSVLANLADNMRHLQRQEINEAAEKFDSKQVGSSTMPHKRNPISFENIKSLWKEFMPRMNTVYLDAISEHQRDLTNSASMRFLPELFAGFVYSVNRMNGLMKNLVLDKQAMLDNFNSSREMIIAEPLYILLACYGHPDAHETVKQLTLKAEAGKKKLLDLARNDSSLKPFLSKFTKEEMQLLENPESYTGLAEKKVEMVCRHWKKELSL